MNRFTVHCAVTRNGQDIDVNDLHQWHVNERGYRKIGYHFLINPSGQVWSFANDERFRSLSETGAHVKGANYKNIGICFAGTDLFSKKQFWEFYSVCHSLVRYNGLQLSDITCHYEYPSARMQGKTCPNMKVQRLALFLGTGDLKHIKPYLIKEN